MNKRIVLGFFVLLLSPPREAAFASEKNQYHLFNPTPVELMREMSTDRPDKTESAYTVDAGHMQIETSVIDYTTDKHNPEGEQGKTDTLGVMETNLKLGLTNSTDIQLVIVPYTREKTRDDTEETLKQGFHDMQLRLKQNIWGNDEGNTALAVMPFVKFPTNEENLGNDAYEGGVIIPLAVALPHDWSMGLMAEFDFNENASGDDYHTEYIQSITFSHMIAGDLGGYIEFFSNISDEDGSDWVATVDGGLTYALNKDIQLDAGVNIGVTRAADDINPFLGLSMRY